MTESGKTAVRVLMAVVTAALAGSGSARAADDAPAPASAEATTWDFGPSLLLYVVPGEPAYFQPTLTVDRGGLHLEARYNYEARETGSAWVGWNFSFGEELKLGLTPMAGVVFGRMTGVAPGLTLTLDW